MLNFRQETEGKGLSSYPHPWLMPEFWQFPDRLHGVGATDGHLPSPVSEIPGDEDWPRPRDGKSGRSGRRRVRRAGVAQRHFDGWPRAAGQSHFVINCNLQRLDGPVRGNGKIIQELESVFRGAGWNVIKTIWGRGWDRLLEKDQTGLLLQCMEECVDGEYQDFRSKNGAYIREHFFGKYPELRELVADMSDGDIWALRRGGHDSTKVYAAYAAAVKHRSADRHSGQDRQGLWHGRVGRGPDDRPSGQEDDPRRAPAIPRPVSDPDPGRANRGDTFIRFSEDSPELTYLRERRQGVGRLPAQPPGQVRRARHSAAHHLRPSAQGVGRARNRPPWPSSRCWARCCGTKNIGKFVVPIVPDESRTFGMEGMFRQLGIYSAVGQLYKPQDADQLMYYREDKSGQVLQEGINEAGAMSSWIAAATSYSTNNLPMIPFYIYYSMFGLQRVGDLAWAAGDLRAVGSCSAARRAAPR